MSKSKAMKLRNILLALMALVPSLTVSGEEVGSQYSAPPESYPLSRNTIGLLRVVEGKIPDAEKLAVTRNYIQKDADLLERMRNIDQYVANANANPNLTPWKKRSAEFSRQYAHYTWQSLENYHPSVKEGIVKYWFGMGRADEHPIMWPRREMPLAYGTTYFTVFDTKEAGRLIRENPNITQSDVNLLFDAFEYAGKLANVRSAVWQMPVNQYFITPTGSRMQLANDQQVPYPAILNVDTYKFADDGAVITKAGYGFMPKMAEDKFLIDWRMTQPATGQSYFDSDLSTCKADVEEDYTQICAYWPVGFLSDKVGEVVLALDRVVRINSISFNKEQAALVTSIKSYKKSMIKFVMELDDLNLVSHPYKIQDGNNITDAQKKIVYAKLKRVVMLFGDKVVWSQDATEFPLASAAQDVAKDSFIGQFPAVLSNPSEAADFLVAKYLPDLVTDRMLEAMMSSRWRYEKEVSEPLGGRFFTTGAMEPSSSVIEDLQPKFKAWLFEASQKLPNKLSMDVGVQYGSFGVVTKGSCPSHAAPPEGALLRMNATEIKKAKRKVASECKDEVRQLTHRISSCKDYRSRLESEVKRKESVCKSSSTSKNTKSGTLPAEATSKETFEGPCAEFGPVNMFNIQQVMMQCAQKQCGDMQKAMADPALQSEFKQCIQGLQDGLMKQVIAGRSGGGIGELMENLPRAKGNSDDDDMCEVANENITRYEKELANSECSEFETKTVRNCEAEVAAVGANDINVYPLGTAVYDFVNVCAPSSGRNDQASAQLLPGNKLYGDTRFKVEVMMDNAGIPYEQPESFSSNKGFAKFMLEITGMTTRKDFNSTVLMIKTKSVDLQME